MGSAQLDRLPGEDTFSEDGGAAAELRREAAARLHAHRQRRARAAAEAAQPIRETRPGKRGAVAAAVKERYAQTPSYRAMLAEEAQRVMEQAAAAAEVALRNAEAVVAAQNELLAELGKWSEPVEFTPSRAEVVSGPRAVVPADESSSVPRVPVPVKEVSAGGLTVKLYEDVGPILPEMRRNKPVEPQDGEEAEALDQEIAFRQAPVFEEYVPNEPAVPLPANLLEFPRQLVAQKKERPRLAEGPLLVEEALRSPQLRIFEVEPMAEQAPEPSNRAPEWSSIWLDAQTMTETIPESEEGVLPSLLPPQVAPMGLRLMAAAVDALLVLLGFVTFCATAVHLGGGVPAGAAAGAGAVATLATLYLGYQALFFTLSDQTPGMRYARIGLCTFTDENPSRSAMRKRILAQLVAVCPLGLGVMWIALDDDRLGWHDRISKMYQRAY